MADDRRAEVLAMIHADRWFAHQFLFEHRHKDVSPDFHKILIADWHGKNPRCLDILFRGSGKSTLAEEAIIIRALMQEFRYCLIVGSSFDRAAQRLHAIRYELEQNEKIETLFGSVIGPLWGADQLMLKNGCLIQAMGKGQSLRGAKHLEQRPDLLFGDDLEEYEDVRTEKARKENLRWFLYDLLPAMDPKYKARIAATPLDPHALSMELYYSGNWKPLVIPWYRIGEGGEKVPTWPERFPLVDIEKREDEAQRSGMMRSYRAEYLCQAEAPEDKPFKQEMFRIVPQVRTWQPVYAMFDPARTTKATSAMTGYAAWSWIANKLVVWESWQRPLMPDQIIEELFHCGDDYAPVQIGVEEDGLNEFLMQPIRHEMAKRRRTLPIKAMKAPKGKIDFIRALQPFFHAREVEFAQRMPDLEAALLSFPTGKIDAPNALAYALPMRPGMPVYHEFNKQHVAEILTPAKDDPAWLALNATRTMTTAVLVQNFDGALRIFADWIYEGEPEECVSKIIELANLEAGQPVRGCAAPQHFDTYNNVGLAQAARAEGLSMVTGSAIEAGRTHLRGLLERDIRHVPAILVAEKARWTLNGFSGGYCHGVTKQGLPTPYAEEGRYRVVMEGLESLIGLMATRQLNENDRVINAYTPSGQGYRSALPMRR